MRQASRQILEKINSVDDAEFLKFYERSKKRKDMCRFIGITYSTENFHKIDERLKSLGIDESILKFKKKIKIEHKVNLQKRLNKISDETFTDTFERCNSVTEMCQMMGFNYKNQILTTLIRGRIIDLKLNITRYKVREFTEENVSSILVKSSRFRGSSLSRILQKFNVSPYDKCQECGTSEWNGKKLVLELHHKDGDNTNNKVENLTFLCPNCHSLTENHRNKKRR